MSNSYSELCNRAVWVEIWVGWIIHCISLFFEFLLLFLEVHMTKIVLITVMVFCCLHVNALHMLVILIVVFSLLLGMMVMINYTFRLIGIYLALLLLTKMIYQTSFIPKNVLEINCTGMNLPIEERLGLLFMDLKWMGYEVLEKEEKVVHIWGSYMLVLLIMTLGSVILIRQRINRLDHGKSGLAPRVLYPTITRKMADESVIKCLKYLLNYGFYKFGFELTLTTAGFVIAFRMDVISVFYSLWILIIFALRRPAVSRLWGFFFVSVAFSILWQYAMAVGFSPLVCLDYPWNLPESLSRWLFLASYRYPPNGNKIIVEWQVQMNVRGFIGVMLAVSPVVITHWVNSSVDTDCVLLIFIWRQKVVFDIEKADIDGKYPGGSNKEIFMEYYKPDFVNPVPDQTAFDRSTLDWIKDFVVTSTLWLTLAFVYWTGVHNVNILSLGYLAGAFIFLWIGHDICLWHMKKILKWWNVLLAYTVLTITIKSIYEIAGCVYFEFLNEEFCWLVQLLNLGCASKETEQSSSCLASKGSVMYWDAVCFGLILFQRRIFCSYYFLHQMDDIKAIVQLQSKGARLIEQLMEDQIMESERRKEKTLDKIKRTVMRIKQWQKKIHGMNYLEPMDHATAVHMGDYYMFEEVVSRDTDYDDSLTSSEEEIKSKESLVTVQDRELTMSRFLGTMLRRTTEDKSVKPGIRVKKVDDKEKDENAAISEDQSTSENAKEAEESKPEGRDMEEESLHKTQKGPHLKAAMNFVKRFLDSVCVSMIRFFDRHSKDYRYIDAAMKEERSTTKKQTMKRTDSGASSSRNELDKTVKSEEIRSKEEAVMVPKPTRKGHKKYNDQYRNLNEIYSQLVVSFSFFVMSHTEFFCYVIIFLHQALSPTILSLPLPLCVLLWGSLTTIRPTTTFWIVLIAYTEVTVLIKAMFQNWIFPWNTPDISRHHPYHPPLLLGIHRNNSYATADLFLLFMLFMHRYKLKRQGMWKRTNEEETLPPRNLGIYNEIPSEKDDKDGKSPELGRELESYSMDTGTVSNKETSKLAKWKCTSRAMAKSQTYGRKTRTKVIVQEIEGLNLVTYDGRRLKPIKEIIGELGEGFTGNIILRVYTSDQINKGNNISCILSCIQHCTPIRKFFMQIVDQKGRLSADFYTLIFFFDFLTFLIVFFGFTHFTDIQLRNGEDHFYFAENQVPLSYLFATLLHFTVIIIDRVLYLRKNVLGKLILQITLVIVIHLWMFLILPMITEASFTELTLPQIYYLIKCLYFLMSAYQMRGGYPLRVQGHFLCKKYGFSNYIAYKGLQFIPFFNQLRTLLDYVCVSSSLSIMEWIKMESMYQIIFERKCSRKADEDYPTKRGIMFPRVKKYIPGTSAFMFLVVVMWFPFFLFAIFETVSEPNQPKIATLDVTLGSFGKIYSTTAVYESIIPFSYTDFDIMKTLYKDNKKVWSFLSNYKFEDVVALKFRFQPLDSWKIRQDEYDRLVKMMEARDAPITVYVMWKIVRTERTQIVSTALGTHKVHIEKNGPTRDQFVRALAGQGNKIFMPHMLPKFIQVNNDGNAQSVSGFLYPRNRTNSFRNVTLKLFISPGPDRVKHWEVRELADDELEGPKISKIPHQDPNAITIYTFNEYNVPKPLLNISRRGIIGLYLSIVLVTWTLIKRFMHKYPTIMFEDLPNVDRLIQLCNDIYLARESHEFALEEDLYAKLIFLFRSPETLIKWTKFRTPEEMEHQTTT